MPPPIRRTLNLTRLGGATLCAALIFLGGASFLRVLNVQFHAGAIYEVGVGGGRLYFARLNPFFIRPPPVTGELFRIGEDYWDYRPWMATFYLDIPITAPFVLIASITIALTWRRRIRCPHCAGDVARGAGFQCAHCHTAIWTESRGHGGALQLALLAFPVGVFVGALFAHGFLAIFQLDQFLPSSTIIDCFFAAIVGAFAYFFSRAVYQRARRTPIASFCCSHCGYTLTGNVGGVCPECGVPIAFKH